MPPAGRAGGVLGFDLNAGGGPGGTRRGGGWRGPLAVVAVALLAVAGCGGPTPPSQTVGETAVAPDAAVPSVVPTSSAPGEGTYRVCAGGRLRLADLATLEAEWPAAMGAATEAARAWQDDARLVEAAATCRLLGEGVRWRARFHSVSAQAFFDSDTGRAVPAPDGAEDLGAIPVAEVSFQVLGRSLGRAGYDDAVEFGPAEGVAVRVSTEAAPFGPPEAPVGAAYFYVALAAEGGVIDLFVSAADGTVYRYAT